MAFPSSPFGVLPSTAQWMKLLNAWLKSTPPRCLLVTTGTVEGGLFGGVNITIGVKKQVFFQTGTNSVEF